MTAQPIILPRSEHSISRKLIDEHTLKVLYRLNGHGFKAYLVGGGVRDLLLGRKPKDFDVGTDATPGQVKKLFRNCFLVGRRFRLAHVRFGQDVVEVATFRRRPEADDLPESPEDHHHFAENVFGTPEEDAFRRDFSINALFYDIANFSIIDYVGGLADLQARRLRVIGDPDVRFGEDPVRMLRALEFAARLDFTLDPAAATSIRRCAPQIAAASPARIREELMELFRHKVAGQVLGAAASYGLLAPLVAGYAGDEPTFELLARVDARTAAGMPIDEGFAIAALHYPRFRITVAGVEQHIGDVVKLAGHLLAPHCDHFHVAAGTRHQARELLVAAWRLSRGPGQRGERRFIQHPVTRVALELLTLWNEVNGADREQIRAWQQLLSGDNASALDDATGEAAERSGRRRRRRRRPRTGRPAPRNQQ
jgi:poly(A) polymerase